MACLFLVLFPHFVSKPKILVIISTGKNDSHPTVAHPMSAFLVKVTLEILKKLSFFCN